MGIKWHLGFAVFFACNLALSVAGAFYNFDDMRLFWTFMCGFHTAATLDCLNEALSEAYFK